MNRRALTLLALAAVAGAPLALARPLASAQLADAPTASSAASPVVSSKAATAQSDADELGALDRDAQLWKKRAEVAKYKADAKAAETRSLGDLTTPLPPLPMSASLSASAQSLSGSPAAGMGSSRPSLVRIGGADAHFDALIDVDGHIVDVLAGDQIAGGWKVADIDASQVRLTRGKQVLVLR
jgi:type IV pilus biogenesis protein PilP